jgi:hypothetical protein
VVVYGDDETSRHLGTVFGDDVTTSDFLTDRLLLLEGGAQSFRQVCNALLLDQEIMILSGLRAKERAFASDRTPYFTAAQFLQDIREHIAEKGDSDDDLQMWYRNYFGQSKCYIGDPKRPDFDTKQKLMDEAWSLFMHARLHLKLDKALQETSLLRSHL